MTHPMTLADLLLDAAIELDGARCGTAKPGAALQAALDALPPCTEDPIWAMRYFQTLREVGGDVGLETVPQLVEAMAERLARVRDLLTDGTHTDAARGEAYDFVIALHRRLMAEAMRPYPRGPLFAMGLAA